MSTIRSALLARLLPLLAFLVPGLAAAGNLLTTVDSAGVGAFSSMQYDTFGRPVIAYRDLTNGDLKLATCREGCATSTPTWQVVTVDGASGTNVGTDINLRLGFSNNPIIAYGVAGFPNTDDLKVATCYAGCEGPTPSWHIVTVDSAGSVGRYASMDLAYGTNPVISYHDATNGDLKLATCTADCATPTPTWQVVVVESAGVTGLYTSLKVDPFGTPIIAYRNQGTGELRLATCTAGCQGAAPTWAIATVATGGVGFHVSLQVTTEVVVISYYDPFAASVKLATCTANCRTATSSWQLATVDAVEALGTSLRLDSQGRPVVAYFASPGPLDLKLAECTANCASATPTWRIATVDSAGDVGAYPSLQIPSYARAAISYQDATNGDLKLAYVGMPPYVLSVKRASASPTNASQVAFTVTFSAPVTGVDASDFGPTFSGNLPAPTIAQVSGSGTTYTVTVDTGGGSGNLGLAVNDDDSIVFGSDPLGGPGVGNGNYFTGEFYVVDPVAPSIVSVSVPAARNYVTGEFLEFVAQWSENVSYTGGNPTLPITIGGATRQAPFQYHSGNETHFLYIVAADDKDDDGIAVGAALTMGGAVARDGANNVGSATLNAVASTAGVLVNRSLAASLPTTRSTVYTEGQAGLRSVLQLDNAGRPVIAYEEWGVAIRISTCVASCTGPSPTWVHSVVEYGNPATQLSGMELNDGKPVLTYSINGDLRIATCTANCATAAPTWVYALVEAGAWKKSALQLDSGIPVIAYVDAIGDLKMARCVADCSTASPTWVKSRIEIGPANGYGSLWNPSLQLRGGKPVLTYDVWGYSLKYAACLSSCASAAAVWAASYVDDMYAWAMGSSLRLSGGVPIVAFYDYGRRDLKIATCVANCDGGSPAWQVVRVDTAGDVGAGPSLQIAEGRPVVAYYDSDNVRLRFASCTAACSSPTPTWQLETLAVGGYSFDTWTSMQVAGSRAFISFHTRADYNLEFAVVEGSALARSASALSFGNQSAGTTSAAQSVTLTNSGVLPLAIASITASDPQYELAHDCGVLSPLASCTIALAFSPDAFAGALNATAFIPATLSIASAAPGAPHTVSLSGVAEKSLVTHYYRSILRREPDSGGKPFWQSEAARVAALGANVNEVWFALSSTFYASPEYGTFGRDNSAFVTDLYKTFFNRAPDSGGLGFWVGNLAQGMPREVALTEFMFSAEFRGFAQSIFGNTAARAEVDAVVDFYRGLLARLPDDAGFAYWRDRFRAAQCAGTAAVLGEVESISSAFALSAEYAARNRTNAQYVGDLYNAFLRRGGDLVGVQYWIGQLDSGIRTREQLRAAFKTSAEFQGRVNAIIQQGCTP